MLKNLGTTTTRAITHTLSTLVVLCALAAFGTQPASAAQPIKQAGNFGLGLGVGTTAAPVSMKYFLSSDLSIQANAGWWRGWWGGYGCRNVDDRYRDYHCGGYYRNALGLGADLLFEGGRLAGNDDFSLSWEIGGGVGLGLGNVGFGLAAAFVTGLQANIDMIPLDVVIEYRPAIFLVPGFALNLIDFTGHVRYYF